MNTEKLKNAYFAWGCFWCMEWIFEAQEWVKEAVSGYIWWTKETANYESVSSWTSGHREAVKVVYDPEKISFDELIELYWRQIDPTDEWWQFADRWYQYTTAIYYSDKNEKIIAESSKDKLDKSAKFNKPITTNIVAFTDFYPAEEYHQDYYKKSAFRYSLYKKWSWREWYIHDNWWDEYDNIITNMKDDMEDNLKSKLTPLQYKVTQEWWTEMPFDNPYFDNHDDWIYVDIVDWTPLYSSQDKYDSGTGWPSFTKPISLDNVVEEEDNTLFSKRIEVRSKNADSHLWHVFSDWPADKWGLRYCMNSAAMLFIPVDELEEKWYGKYLKLFK